MYRVAVFVCLCLVRSCNTQYELSEGSSCSVDGVIGVCTIMLNCNSALVALKQHDVAPQICSFAGLDPVVCCFEKEATTELEVSTKPQWKTTTPEPPETTTVMTTTLPMPGSRTNIVVTEASTETNTEIAPRAECPPISLNKTAAKTGQKAWDICIEYQERLVLPCDPVAGKRYNYCRNDLNTWILNGEDAYEGEFPHMALVGYGSDPPQFRCGGTLISDSFVMTAGHCASTKDLGPITYVLLGILKRSQYGPENLHRVRTVHKHPQYTPPKKYNDIALLQLDNPVTLSDMMVPACLDVGDMSQEPRATATGWGATELRGMSSDILQKVDLTMFTKAECSERYQPSRHMSKGFDNRSQICYGDRTMSRDTCQGDSGGPLQVRNRRVYCMYTVIGITSLGRLCGVVGEPALYTRVAHYLPWIESIVWP